MFRASGRMFFGSEEMLPSGATGGDTVRQNGRTTIRELTELVLMKINEQNMEEDSVAARSCEELKNYIRTHPSHNERVLLNGIENLGYMNPVQPLTQTRSTSTQYWPEATLGWTQSRQQGLATRMPDLSPQVQPMDGNVEVDALRPHAPPGINTLRYKTELCRSVSEGNGVCRYGDKCQYAHSRDELRHVPKHPLYKTQLCREYHLTSICSYGLRCNFIHDEYKKGGPQFRNLALSGSEIDASTLALISLKRKTIPDVEPSIKHRYTVGSELKRASWLGSTSDLSSLPTDRSRSVSPEDKENMEFLSFGSNHPNYLGQQNLAVGSGYANLLRAHQMDNVFQFAQPFDSMPVDHNISGFV